MLDFPKHEARWRIGNLLSAGMVIFALTPCLSLSAQQESPRPYGSDRAVTEPTIFGEGVISTGDSESHPAFTPDGKTVYFLKDSPAFSFWTICVSHFRDGKWSPPEIAPFSGQYSDADPFITADGSKFFFISNRPLAGVGPAKEDTDIWMMLKEGSGWSSPVNLGETINSKGGEWYPTVAKDGTLYFGSDREGGQGQTDIYRSKLVDGKYSAPDNLGPPINTSEHEYEPLFRRIKASLSSWLIGMGETAAISTLAINAMDEAGKPRRKDQFVGSGVFPKDFT